MSSSHNVTANVRSEVHSFTRSNADVCATDRQRRRSLSLKPVKASSATRQRALGAHRLKRVRENGKKYCAMTLAKTCHASYIMQDFKKQLMGLLQPRKLSESRCFNIPLSYLKKIESHLES